MVAHPGRRSEQPLLFPAPQRHADGALRLGAHGLQDAHRLHHRGRAIGVVCRADAGVPRVEVAADHDNFVLQHRVGARQFGDDVVGIAVVVVEPRRLHAHPQLHGDAALRVAKQHVVLLAGDRQRRHRAGTAVASGNEDGAVFADGRLQQRAGAGITIDAGRALRGGLALRACWRRRTADAGGIRRRVRLIAGVARVRSILAHEVVEERLREDDRALDRALHRLELFGRLVAREHRRSREFARRRRRPAVRVGDDRQVARLDHLHDDALRFPAATELPRFEMRVAQTEVGEPRLRPLRRALVRG